eukprot:9782040-Lingulodinium_polyedra.AAC.1
MSQNIATSSSGTVAPSRSAPAVDVAGHPGVAASVAPVGVDCCTSHVPVMCRCGSCCCAASH